MKPYAGLQLNQPELCPDIKAFVAAVEAQALHEKFDLAVTETVLKDLQTCPFLSDNLYFVHINLCAESLNSASFCTALEQLLQANPMAEGKIRFEITEGVSSKDDHKDNNLLRLTQSGCQFVLGNFITGYSNFGSLINPMISSVKVDRSLSSELTHNDITDKFMKSLIVLLSAIDKKLVVEGVETSAQLEFLRANQADYVQGYYLARPMVKELLAFANNGALLMINEAHRVPITPL